MAANPQSLAVIDSVTEALRRADIVFGTGTEWEATWDITYRFVAPERANFFQKQLTPPDIQEDIFDSTAIDAADDLKNALMEGNFPFWLNWISLNPGPAIRKQSERDRLRPKLDAIRDDLLHHLDLWNFYDAMEMTLEDRIIGGTGYFMVEEDDDQLHFMSAPLSDTRHMLDAFGHPLAVVYKQGLSREAIWAKWRDKLPPDFMPRSNDPTFPQERVIYMDERMVDGMWKQWKILESTKTLLEIKTKPHPRFYPTRWSPVPHWPYGRGPALKALSDIRALNKLKELVLLNAAKAVAGVYTGTDDGVFNPYTATFEPQTVIPVLSNDPNNPTLRPLENSTNFDVAAFSMDNLINSIRAQFMIDQFGSLNRTPRSAEEISQRAQLVTRHIGATLLRLQNELVIPILKRAIQKRAMLDESLSIVNFNDNSVKFVFNGDLATAQQARDANNIVEFVNIAVQFGQVDPLAGFTVNIPDALRRFAQLRGVPVELLRSQADTQGLLDQAKSAIAESVSAGGITAGLPQQTGGAR